MADLTCGLRVVDLRLVRAAIGQAIFAFREDGGTNFTTNGTNKTDKFCHCYRLLMNVAATWLHVGCTLMQSRCQETSSGFTKRTRNCAKDGDD